MKQLVDTPSCLINGTWTQPKTARLGISDRFNREDGDEVIDRHDCGVIDANGDSRPDIYCLVGANRGTKFGYNELYLTRKDGSLKRILRHGLQKIKTMRSRHTAVLKGANGTEYVFISTIHGKRKDGKPNQHRIYRKNGKPNPIFNRRYFQLYSPEKQPWLRYTDAECALSVDVNKDGLDDILVCNGKREPALLMLQDERGGFHEVLRGAGLPIRNWRNARLADFDGDGRLDLAVVYRGYSNSTLRVFRGIRGKPYFDFNERGYFSRSLPYAAPDLEVLDVNGDGKMDIYVVQDDQVRRYPNGTSRSDVYCGGYRHISENWWSGGRNRITPPWNYVPPRDKAPDLLFLGVNSKAPYNNRFRQVRMKHSEPGCGYRVKKFGQRSLLLAQGSFDRPGHQLFLKWK